MMKQETAIENLAKQVEILKIYAIVLTLVVLAFIGYTLNKSNNHFKEITAERINIVERTGKLRLVISNKERQHPGMMDNKAWPKRDRPAGLIFFNDIGDECGGLVYDGDKNSSSMTYSIDQYKNDQIMQLQYAQENNSGQPVKSYGLKLWDRSDKFTLMRLANYDDSLKKLKDTGAYKAGMAKLKAAGLLSKQRLFVGKDDNGDVGLFLNDAQGKPRLKICINKQNQPVIETLDDKGAVIASR
jgi:hypothetical protein